MRLPFIVLPCGHFRELIFVNQQLYIRPLFQSNLRGGLLRELRPYFANTERERRNGRLATWSARHKAQSGDTELY